MMKKYESPAIELIEFMTEDALLDGSIIDPGEEGGKVEIGPIPIFD